MTKTKATPKATQAQIERIDDLGQQIFGRKWGEAARTRVIKRGLTYDQAKEAITDLQTILGGKA